MRQRPYHREQIRRGNAVLILIVAQQKTESFPTLSPKRTFLFCP